MKTISKTQRLQLVGVLTLAAKHIAALEDLKSAAYEITGEEDDLGHTNDAIWDEGRRDADALLGRLKIKVRK